MAINYPIVNEGLKYVNGLKLSRVNNSTISVTAGQCRNSTNVNDIALSSNVNVNLSNNGAAGLDQGSKAANTFYAVFAIDDSSKNNPGSALASTSATDPILPLGYDMVRRIGWIRTNGAGDILRFFHTGNGSTRRMTYDDTLVAVLTAGNATTFTDVDCSAIIPSTAVATTLQVSFTPATAGTNQLKLRPNGSISTPGIVQANGTVNSVASLAQLWVPVVSSVFEYSVTNASDAATISVLSYEDEL